MNRLLASLLLIFLIQGCSEGEPSFVNGRSLQGVVHGGRQPIVGSTVLIFAASGQAASPPTFLGQATTDSSGQFQLAAFAATPSTGDLIYAVALGGDAGNGSSNANISLMGIAGVYGNALSNIQINELSTVVAAAQLSANLVQTPCQTLMGLSSSAICPQANGSVAGWDKIWSGFTALINPGTGILTASNAADIENINLQASVLADCVNSSGGGAGTSTACGQLMRDSTSSFSLMSSLTLTGNGTQRMALSPDGGALYVLDQDNNTISTIGTDHGALSWINSLSMGALAPGFSSFTPFGIDASPDGNYVLAKNSGRFTVFQTSKTGVQPVNGTVGASTFSTIFVQDEDISQIIFSKNSNRFFISGPAESIIYMYTLVDGRPAFQDYIFDNQVSPACMAVSNDAKYLFWCDISNRQIAAYSLALGSAASGSGALGQTIPNSPVPVSLAVPMDGKYVFVLANSISDGVSSTISVFSNSEGQLSAWGSAVEVAGNPTAFALSPDARWLAVSINSPNCIAIYQVDSGHLNWLQSIATDRQAWDVKFSLNGRYLYATVPGPVDSAQGSILSFTTPHSTATDTFSALLNLNSKPSTGAATLYELLPQQPVFTPVPTSTPSTLIIP